jgi:hypothetical protein
MKQREYGGSKDSQILIFGYTEKVQKIFKRFERKLAPIS